MKYKNISLNNCEGKVALIKYNKDLEGYAASIEKIDKLLASSITSSPETFSESSDFQAYLIMNYDGDTPEVLGGIHTSTSSDEKFLEVTLGLDESKFSGKEDMVEFIEKVYQSLCRFWPNQSKIEFTIINDIDLAQENSEYETIKYSENTTTYLRPNNTYPVLHTLIDDLKKSEDLLMKWGATWLQYYELMDKDFGDADKDLANLYENRLISAEEIFSKATKVEWKDIFTANNNRNITFESDGKIRIAKRHNNTRARSYRILLDLATNGLSIINSEPEFSVEDNRAMTSITSRSLSINVIKEKRHKTIHFTKALDHNSSVVVDISIGEDNKIEKCYMDFRRCKYGSTTKYSKVTGTYALRIAPKNNICSLKFISRKGLKSNELLDNPEALLEYINKNGLTFSEIVNIIEIVSSLINDHAELMERTSIYLDEFDVNEILIKEKECIAELKTITGEVPVESVSLRLFNFTHNYE